MVEVHGGPLFWSVITFLLLLFILSKVAWGPIISALETREKQIREALDSAANAKADAEKATADYESIKQEAQVEAQKLLSDAKIAKENMIKLEQAHQQQQKVIEQQRIDFEAIVQANKKIVEENKRLEKEYSALDKKFNKINASGKKRDLGALAVKKPRPIEKIINKGSDHATRCVRVAMGDPLTEEEKNAVKKSQINPICPDLVNPSYVPY